MIRRLAIVAFALCSLYFTALAQPAKVPMWIPQEKFLRACEDGDVDVVKKYLADGGSVNVRDRFGQPAMLRVARGVSSTGFDKRDQLITIVELLLKAGADINARNDFGTTAIFLTGGVMGHDTELHRYLLAKGADRTVRDKYDLDPDQRPDFYRHAKIDPSEVAWRYLIEGDLARPPDDLNTVKPRPDGATFRMAAVYYGDSAGFSPTFQWVPEFDKNGESYLFYAAGSDKLTGFELKVIPPAILNAPNKNGETALIRATQFDNGPLIIKLLAAGASPDVKDGTGRTPLMYAVDYDQFVSTMNLLAKADPNARDAMGRTPLMYAVFNQRTKAFEAFVAAKVSIPKLVAEAKRLPKVRSSDLALAANFRRIDVNARDNNGRTALMLAVFTGNADLVKAMLDFHPNVLIKDNDGLTALAFARENGSTEIVKLLSKRR